MSSRPAKPFVPNEAQRKWLAGLTPASAIVKGASITIAELHELLDNGLLVLANNRAGYARAAIDQQEAA